MKWGAPEMLILLWVILPLGWLVIYLSARRRKRLARLVSPAGASALAPEAHAGRTRLLELIWLSTVLLLLFALARPQWGVRWEEVRRRGLDIIVVLDTSRSMLATDLKPDRLQQSKWAVRDLVQRLKGDRVGLISFAGSSFLQCPLTIDYAAFLMTLEDVYVGIIPRGGSAIGQALSTAASSFDEGTSSDKVIILISDGEDHDGITGEVLGEMKDGGIRVFAIGAATLEGELIPMPDGAHGGGFVKDRAGRVVKSSLEESALEQIALASGGAYVRAVPGDFGVERILEEGLAGLERDEKETRLVQYRQDRFGWFIGAALLLLFIEAVMSKRVRRSAEVAS